MQCSNCQFENMPGIQTCGRCGANLQLATLGINVHPPRASRAAKLWRRWFPVAPFVRRAVGPSPVRSPPGAPTGGNPVFLRRQCFCGRSFPGWPQYYAGRTYRGKCIFWSYLGLLLTGLLFAGAP